jgi:hypothetical protein
VIREKERFGYQRGIKIFNGFDRTWLKEEEEEEGKGIYFVGRERWKEEGILSGHLPVGEKWPPKMMIDDMYCKRSFLREKKPLSLFLSHFILGPYYL